MRTINFLAIVVLLITTVSCNLNYGKKDLVLTSPDGYIQLKIDNEADFTRYNLFYDNLQVVSSGTWGIQMNDTILFGNNHFQINGPKLITDTFTLRTGKTVIENYHEYDLQFSDKQKIQIRLFNNACAYRYLIQEKNQWHILNEMSSWTVPDSFQTWFTERNNHWKLKSYAGEWISCQAGLLNTISSMGPIQGPPLIFEYGNEIYGMLTEAALYNYSGMRLLAEENGKLSVDFTEKDGFTVDGELVSPWRVFYIGKGLTQLVNQQVINALNPEPDPALFSDKSFIKPGKSAWRWWSKGTGTPAEELEITNFAAALGFEYSIIDQHWERWDNAWEEVQKITNHAKNNNVNIMLWKYSKELNLPENDYQVMRDWLDKIKASGAVGAKVDFMESESKSTIDFIIRLLQESAKRQLVINFHGCNKPTGENFTYPNELTREGIRGLELNKLREGPITTSHNTALPFTRFVVGDGDYTPLGFTNPANTTWTHQLATLVCFTSFQQVIAEHPEFLLTNPKVKPVLDFIKNVPVIWDETIVLNGSQIGNVAAMARRAGNDWYVGILNTTGKQFEVDFSFLGEGSFKAEVVEDIPAKTKPDQMFLVSWLDVSAKTKREFNLPENGGLVIKLTKE
jgi:alpha-glucosidase